MKVRVHYPLGTLENAENATLAVRTESDWERDVAARRALRGTAFEFDLGDDAPFRYFKPVLRMGDELRWAQGANAMCVRGSRVLDVYPYFDPDASCHVCDVHTVPASFEERGYDVRVWVPPGYDENVLERFPTLYMQDGQNLFFPEEAFGGKHWRVPETLEHLRSMNLIRQVIVVGVVPRERERDYTAPGYDDYVAFLADELRPWVDEHYRTLAGPRDTAVMGSSLGGVVSLHAAWTRPDVFGSAGCMSSTFGYRDDLLARVVEGPRRPIRVYLDTGWPHDNYEVNRSMRQALLLGGHREGVDLRYAAFPRARHDEEAWADRAHLAFQFFFGEA